MLGKFDTALDIAHEFLEAGVHKIESAAILNAFYIGAITRDLDLLRIYHDAAQDDVVAEWISALESADASAAFKAHQQIVYRFVSQSMYDFKVDLGDQSDD